MTNENIILRVENLSKLYGIDKYHATALMKEGKDKAEILKRTNVNVALNNVSLEIPKEKIVTIIGLSGSGKSTLIRCFNRLNTETTGAIFFGDKNLKELSKKELMEFRRNKVSMVFQSFALLSNRNVMQNVAYGLEVKGMGKAERETKAKEYLTLVGLEGYENSEITQLSGGMKQRVGIARALCNESEIILMDEPFSALDPLVKSDLQFELLQIQRKLNKTIIFITHDIDEAFKLGDYVAIMKDGEIIQYDTPENMSLNPKTDYVRSFIENADKAKILTVKNIMIKPDALIKQTDSVEYAIHVMKKKAFSTVYVINNKLEYKGIVAIKDAIRAKEENLTIKEILNTTEPTVKSSTLISDILSLASESNYPLAVVDENNLLEGIVTKSSVLSTLSK